VSRTLRGLALASLLVCAGCPGSSTDGDANTPGDSPANPLADSPATNPAPPADGTTPGQPSSMPVPPSSSDPTHDRWGEPEFWAVVTREWQPYTHSNGFRMKLPPGWTVRDTKGSLTLRPLDPELKGLGFGVGHVPRPDVTDAHDPTQFSREFDSVRSGLSQYNLQRVGDTHKQLDIGDRAISGASMVGTSPRSGDEVFGVFYLAQTGADRAGHFVFVLTRERELLETRGRFLARALISTFKTPSD
jgi:hypothetical protein